MQVVVVARFALGQKIGAMPQTLPHSKLEVATIVQPSPQTVAKVQPSADAKHMKSP